MAIFTFAAPDGKQYDIEAPEGATQDQAFEYLKSNWDTISATSTEPAKVNESVETPVAQTPEQPVAEPSLFDKAKQVGTDIENSPAYQSAKQVASALESSPIGSVRRYAYDQSLALSKGLIGVPEFITGIADIASGGEAGKYLEEKGIDYKAAKDYLTAQQSPEEQAAQKEIQSQDTFGGTLKSAVTNPVATVNTALESLPASYVGGRIGGAVKALGGLGKASSFVAPAAGELLVGAGQQAEGTRQETETGLLTGKQSALAVAAGAGDAFLAGVGGVVAKKLGIADFDTLSNGTGSVEVANKSVLKQALGGVFTEGVLEELPQSTQEQILQNIALDKPDIMEGVSNAAAIGLVTGGLMGGGYSLADMAAKNIQRQDKPQPEGTPIAESMLQGGLPTTEQATPTSDKTTSTLQEYKNIFTDENLTRKGNAPDTNETVVGSEAPIVDNQKIDEEIGKTTTADEAIKAFTDIVEANSIGSEINMEYANKIADRFTKTKEVEITDKDYQDAVQLEQQLSTVRDELAYRKFQKGYEQAKQNEVDDLIAKEINDKNQQLAQVLEQQRNARIESSVPSINQTIENEQWAKTRNNRNSVIQMVFDRDIPAENIFPAIKAELKRQGFKDTEINQDDIDAYNLLKSTPTTPVVQAPEMIPPTENEMNVEGLIKEKVEPVISEQVSPALRKVDEWVNNGATYKNGMLFDIKGKKFLLNKAQREYYLISRSNPLATTPVDMGNQLPLTTQRGTDQITGVTEKPKPPMAQTPVAMGEDSVGMQRGTDQISGVGETLAETPVAETKQQINPEVAGNLKSGDIVVDANGKEYLAQNARHDYLEAFPIVNGKADVSKDTLVTFHLSDRNRDAFKERDNTPIFTTGKNLYSEMPVAETVKTGTIENPILKKNGSGFPSQQSAQTYIRTNSELSSATHTTVKLDSVKYGADKYGIVTKDQVVSKATNPAANLNKVQGNEELRVLIQKLGGLSRIEMKERGFTDYKGNTRLFNNGVRSRTFDDMATVLRADHGFDEIQGANDLETALWGSLNGKPYYGYEGIDNAMDKMAADKADQEQQNQDELLNTYTNDELNKILDAKTQAEKDQIIQDIKAEKKRKADQEVDTVVDEMLGKGKTTTMDIFTPERKGKVAVGREVTVEGEQLANSGTKVKELYPNHWFYGNKGAQDKFNDTEIDYEGEYPNLESISLINTDSNIGGFYDQVEQAIYQTTQSDRTTLHELGHAIHHQLLNYRKLTENERAILKEMILGDEQANHPYLASDKELVAEFNLYAHLFPVKAKVYLPELYKELVEGRKEVVIKLGSQESQGLTQALKQANVTIEKGYGEEKEPITNKYKLKEYTEEERASQKKYRLNNFERARSEIDALQKGLGFTLLDESDDFLLYSKYNGSSPHLIQYILVTKNMSPPIGSMFVFNGAGEVINSRLNYHKTARKIYGKDKADDMMYKAKVDDKQVLESLKDKIGEGDIFPEKSNVYDSLSRITFSRLDSIDPLETEEGRIKQIENMLKGKIVPKSNIKFSKAKVQERLAPNGKPSNLNATQYEQVRTPEFKAWFGDWENDPENASKVVDENGEPLVAYHATGDTFTEFDTNKTQDSLFWFTSNIDNIANVGAANTKNIMPVFLNIKNLAGWDEYDNLNTDQIIAKDFDGIQLDEDFVAFNPNQIKSATGNTGEFSKESNDIRFSKTVKKVLDDNPLAIVHNLNLKNLVHADKMGGLPAPSIAVVNQKYPLSGFGEITLIGDTSQFAPEADKANRFYNADVYSPRYPNVTYTVDSKAVSNANEALSDDAKALAKAIGYRGTINASSIEDRGLVQGLADNVTLKYEFLKSIGKAPKLQYKVNKLPPANMKKFVTSNTPSMELSKDPTFVQAVVDNYNESIRKRNETLNQNRPYLEVESQQASNLAFDYQYVIEEFRNQKGKPKLIDDYATSKLIREKTNQAQYEKWLVENYSNLISGERIFNGYTNAGNRIYLPHNLDTVVKLMTKTVKGGENVSYGIGIIRAHTAKQFKTVKAIQASRSDIVSAEKLEALKEELSNEFENLSEELRPYSDYSNPSAADALSDLVSKGTRAFKESYQDVPTETMTKVYDFLDKLKNMPAHYFEGKIGRAVKLNEFAGALVPKGKEYDEAVKILNANGVTKIKRYAENDSQSRSDALLNFSELLFSQTQEPTVDNHTEQSLKEGLTQAGDNAYGKGWTDRLLATGMFEFISDADAQAIVEEAAEVSYSKNGDIEAFFNPAEGKTYFVSENISKDKDLHYLMMHEVSVHMLNMGENKTEFEKFLKATDNLVKVKNPAALKGRQDALDADTPQEDLREETLAYLVKYVPKLKVVQQFKAWLKNALRNMAKSFPAAQRLGFIQWANKLSDQDLLYIANATLRKAPEMLGINERESNSLIFKTSKALSVEQMRALGQLDLLGFIQEIADIPRKNSRIGMTHEQILDRIPELNESANNMMAILYDNNMLQRGTKGNLVKGVSTNDIENFAKSNPEFRKLAELHDALVDEYKPVEPYKTLPTPATKSEMQEALAGNKVSKINQLIPDGYKVKLRLDIPAYVRGKTWVVTAHEGNSEKNSIFGVKEDTAIGYYGYAVADNPQFSVEEFGSLKIATKTVNKYPLATVDGKYVNMSAQEAKRLGDEALDNPNWVQVGMDPERHSYFYDRKTMRPVLSGSRVIQIGSILMVENPIFGNKKSFLFSKNTNPQNPDGSFNIPAESSFQFLRKWIQDDLLRIRVVMDRIREQGGKVDESNDVVLAMEAVGNIAANQLEKLKERYIQPLIDRMAKMNVNKDEIGLLLYAKHAPERNAYIQSINPKFRKLGEGGSGMTDAESAAIIKRYKETMGDKYAEFEKLTDDWQNIQTIVKNILVASGDISPEQAQSWEDGFDYHVPLKGFEEVDEVTGKAKKSSRGNIGQGFSISGKFDRKMLGRQSRANQIVENIVMNLERAVIRSSKMYVQSTLYKLVEDNPDINLWENEVTPMKPIMGKAKAQYVMYFHGSEIGVRDTLRDARRYVEAETARTGQEKREYEIVKVGGEPQVTLMRKPYDQNEEISYWRNGKQVRIVVNDEAFVQAFNRLGDENIYSMFKVLAAFNRFLRHSYTILNPAFIIANGVMVDPAVALYTNTARQGFKYASTVLAKTPMASLQIAKYMAKGSTSNAEWDNAIRLYYDNGGKSGSAFISSIEQKADELNLAVLKSKILDTKFYEYPLDKLKLMVVDNKLANFLKYLGEVGETATRLSTFKVAIDNGKSPQEAAKIARNVTINFNRRGVVGRELGAMYLFLNASIQGTENLVDATIRGEHKVQAAAMLSTYVTLGYLIALLGGDDGDDDLIPEEEKTRFLSVTLDEKTGLRVDWKLPYGLSFWKDVGTAIARIQLGGDPEKITNKLMSSFFNNFSYVNPMVSGEWNSKDLISGLIPTAGRIPFSVNYNRNQWGKPIYPENVYDNTIPDSEKEWSTTRGTLFSDFAKWMNKVTGGSKVESGLIDVSPESMKYTLNALTGSVGTQAYKFVNSLYTSSMNAEEMSVGKLPLISNFVKEDTIDAYRRVYTTQRKEAEDINDKFKKYEKLADDAAIDKFVTRNQSLLDFYDETKSIIKDVKDLRKKQDEARIEGDKQLLKELENDEKELLIEYNYQYNRR